MVLNILALGGPGKTVDPWIICCLPYGKLTTGPGATKGCVCVMVCLVEKGNPVG